MCICNIFFLVYYHYIIKKVLCKCYSHNCLTLFRFPNSKSAYSVLIRLAITLTSSILWSGGSLVLCLSSDRTHGCCCRYFHVSVFEFFIFISSELAHGCRRGYIYSFLANCISYVKSCIVLSRKLE